MADWGRLLELAAPYPTRHLAVVDPQRSYTTPHVARVIAWAADVAAEAYGGKIQIGDLSGPNFGEALPPHQTHRQGRQVDVGYTSDRYPSVLGVPMDLTVAYFLTLLRPYIWAAQVSAYQRDVYYERVVESDKIGALGPSLIPDGQDGIDGYVGDGRAGHDNRIHILFPTEYGAVYDDDGAPSAVKYKLPAAPDDFGWAGTAEEYPFVRQILRLYLDAPELLQSGGVQPGQPTLASRVLAARAYNYFRYYRAPSWPPLSQACQAPNSAACRFYASAVWYLAYHEDWG